MILVRSRNIWLHKHMSDKSQNKSDSARDESIKIHRPIKYIENLPTLPHNLYAFLRIVRLRNSVVWCTLFKDCVERVQRPSHATQLSQRWLSLSSPQCVQPCALIQRCAYVMRCSAESASWKGIRFSPRFIVWLLASQTVLMSYCLLGPSVLL